MAISISSSNSEFSQDLSFEESNLFSHESYSSNQETKRRLLNSTEFVRGTCTPWRPSWLEDEEDSRRWPRYWWIGPAAWGTMIRGTKRASLYDHTENATPCTIHTHTHTNQVSSFHALWERKHFSPPASPCSPKHRGGPRRFHNFVLAYRSHPQPLPLCFFVARPVSRLFSSLSLFLSRTQFPADRKKEKVRLPPIVFDRSNVY